MLQYILTNSHILEIIFNTYFTKTNKKQFKILEKGKYVTQNQIFEGFLGISDDLAMN